MTGRGRGSARAQSALSHTTRRLETRLGVRLLTRTTHSVAPTEAGERLLGTLGPAFDSIGARLESLSSFRDKPSGTIRITASEQAATTLLWPALAPFPRDYPDLHVELALESGLSDIVTDRFDAGVSLAKDMIAARIGSPLRMAVAGPRGDSYRRFIQASAAGRAGTPDEVGTIGALLMGPDGGFITGSDILMDGGVTAAYRYGDLAPT